MRLTASAVRTNGPGTTAASVRVAAPLWRLEADPERIDDAPGVALYRRPGPGAVEDVTRPADLLMATGAGQPPTGSRRTAGHSPGDLFGEGDLADIEANRLEHSAWALRSAQNQLDDSWSHLAAHVPGFVDPSGDVVSSRSTTPRRSWYSGRSGGGAIRSELDDPLNRRRNSPGRVLEQCS